MKPKARCMAESCPAIVVTCLRVKGVEKFWTELEKGGGGGRLET